MHSSSPVGRGVLTAPRHRQAHALLRRCEDTPALPVLALLLLLLLTGCAYTTQVIKTEATGTNGVVEVRSTRNRAVAWGDARQVIEKLKLSNGKTQSIGVTGLDSEATTTNLAPNMKAFVELINALKTP